MLLARITGALSRFERLGQMFHRYGFQLVVNNLWQLDVP